MDLPAGHQYIYFLASDLWKKLIFAYYKVEKSCSLFITQTYSSADLEDVLLK